MLRLVASTLVSMSACAAASHHATSEPRQFGPEAWPRLRDGLAGEWRGTTDDGATVDAHYQAISGGNALAETFGGPARATMTLYHPDHGGLVATHYCAQGNQPRLRATEAAAARVRFVQTDITDLDADESQLVELTFELAADRFERIEDYRAPDGTIERTRWHLVRVPAP